MNSPDRQSSLRIIDANLNRGAEALRVAEDVCRFHWNLPGLSEQLKNLRHGLFATVTGGTLRREELLRCRDIEGDVGRSAVSPPRTDAEPATLALRNLERAKEAFRTLEEALRLLEPGASAELQKLRYELYAVEKCLAFLPPRGDLHSRVASAHLYLLATANLSCRPLEAAVTDAVKAGCDVVQLREKNLPARDLLDLARRLREITARWGALFTVNDRPDVALLAHADGVHLGQQDLPLAEVRQIVGEKLLIGISTHSVEEAVVAERQGADYIGVGPVFPTETKENPEPLLGVQGLRDVLESVSLPAFAIGGIDEERLSELVDAGCRRIAVSSYLLGSRDVSRATKALREKLTSQSR